MKNSTLIFLLMSFLSYETFAQKVFSTQPTWDGKNFIISYYGDYATNPGAKIAYEKAFINKVKTKNKIRRGKDKTKHKSNFLEVVPSFSIYTDPGSHSTFIPNATLQYKRVNNKRWMMNFGLGVGLWNQVINNVITVQDGIASNNGMQLRSYVAPSFNWSFGRVKIAEGNMKGVDFGIQNHFLLNFNNSVQLAPAMVVGYRF